MVLTLALIALLMAVNALCVAAEYSVVSARRSRIRSAAERGDRLAKGLLPVLERAAVKDRYISGCQLGITVTSLALGALAQDELAAHFVGWFAGLAAFGGFAAHTVAITVILIVLTLLQVAFAEVLPKAIALQYPNPVAIATSPLIRVWLAVLSLPISCFTAVANGLLRVLRLPDPRHQPGHAYTPNEIQLLVDESRRGGVLEARTSTRLQRALELKERPVRRLMVHRNRVFAVDLEHPTPDVVAAIMSSEFTRVPVYRGTIDGILGMIHTKDLALRFVERGVVDGLDELVRPVLYVPETTPAEKLLAEMRDKSTAQAIVLDEFGGMAGLITVEDLLADVVGSVRHRASNVPAAEALPDGRLRIPGNMRLDDAARTIGATWSGYANTVGGYVVEWLGHLPGRGDKFDLEGVDVEVEGIQRGLITALRVKRTPPRLQESRDG